MKKRLIILGILLISIFSSCLIYIPEDGRRGPVYTERSYEPDYAERTSAVISLSFIYDYLSGHGYWVRYRHYGYVWVPRRVPRHWRPYTYGRWVWTEYGWTWFSYFDWGWLPFHYGRWGWDVRLGWFWVPDTIWAPAWVIWRAGDIYVGWAPLPPEVEFVIGYGFRWRIRELPHHYWVFIEVRRFGENRLLDWVIPPERNITIINFTVVRDRISFKENKIINDALKPEEIERWGRKPVTRVKLQEMKQPEPARLSYSAMSLYKPEIKREQAVPKAVLEEAEAAERIKMEKQVSSAVELDRIHRREEELLKKTQQLELENLKRKIEEESRSVTTEQKRKELDVKLQELKKKHEEEKKALIKRHQKEKQEKEKSVKKENLRKKG
ncbi:MAG: hypothetical protein H5U07_11255 [Candidatus Aminicenantes bacterium]|nr:hypothetical protein [Candidatus Aminicenantes bacterium]